MDQIEHIATNLLTRGLFPVKITGVTSPSAFWALPMSSAEEFREMSEELQRTMERKDRLLHCWPNQLVAGAIVAIKSRGVWCRGQVGAVKDFKAEVLLKDSGRRGTRHFTQIFQLPRQFRELRWQAIPCRLGGIAPIDEGCEWTDEACDLMQALTEGKQGWIRIRDPLDGYDAEVSLYTSKPLGLRDIGRALLYLGYATTP